MKGNEQFLGKPFFLLLSLVFLPRQFIQVYFIKAYQETRCDTWMRSELQTSILDNHATLYIKLLHP